MFCQNMENVEIGDQVKKLHSELREKFKASWVYLYGITHEPTIFTQLRYRPV